MEKISHTTSPEYQKIYSKEQQSRNYSASRVCFGSRLEKLQDLSKKELVKDYKKQIEILRAVWQQVCASERRRHILFDDIAKSEKTCISLVNFLEQSGVIFSEEITGQFLAEVFNSQPELYLSLPDELLVTMAQAHVDLYKENDQKFTEQELPGLVEWADKKFTSAIEQGILPVEKQVWEHVRQNTSVYLGDPVLAPDVAFEEGNFSEKNGIMLYRGNFSGEVGGVLAHEYLHALSGKTVVRREMESKESEGFDDNYEEVFETKKRTKIESQRVGLGFVGGVDDLLIKTVGTKRFGWLNEAVTEYLNIKIAGVSTEMAYYGDARKLLYFLLQSLGEDGEGLVVRAYFENYDPATGESDHVPNYRKFAQAIQEKIGNQFLVHLDQYIQGQRDGNGQILDWQQGTANAVKHWEKQGQNFYNFIELWHQDQEQRFNGPARKIVEHLKTSGRIESLFWLEYGYDFKIKEYEQIWKNELSQLVPHPSKFELAAIKDIVARLLEKEIIRKQREDQRMS